MSHFEQVMPQDIPLMKYWACSHAGKVGSKKNNYTCGHSVIICPKCERKSKDDCPLPGCCSNKNATSASPAKKKSVVQQQGQPESSSDNLFYLILPPEVVLTILKFCMANLML